MSRVEVITERPRWNLIINSVKKVLMYCNLKINLNIQSIKQLILGDSLRDVVYYKRVDHGSIQCLHTIVWICDYAFVHCLLMETKIKANNSKLLDLVSSKPVSIYESSTDCI